MEYIYIPRWDGCFNVKIVDSLRKVPNHCRYICTIDSEEDPMVCTDIYDIDEEYAVGYRHRWGN